ncbi:nucleotide exchange factor GrpE [Streptomyces scopuliridis]|uniref:Nucleotide exchange factor GrpE n=1 Tax=Streptomyces scopuliridis TaxID=452529 RepID=A0ACD4ZRC3_9ACTN|nr:nucleotide exchange factor GrpE [Streptomyces scopuliridis]WSC00986.1 nucleotide exchange factor GrpE [Streptomyces scopuliridis]WSC05404.1 nucleotide exchange factor GrpE [Streptomyces scopuliridis]
MTAPSSAQFDSDTERLIAQLRKRCEALERRRTEYEDELARRDAQSEASLRRLLTGLLDVDDALAESLRWSANQDPTVPDRAASALASLTEQVSAAHKLLRHRLLAADVRAMDLVHQRAEPAIARVVGARPTSRYPADLVLEERLPGFYLGQQVLRTAEVVVAVSDFDPGLDPSREPAREPKQPRQSTTARRQPRRLPRHKRRTRRRS